MHVAAGVSDRSGSQSFHANGDYAKTGSKNFLSFATTRLDASSTPPIVVPTMDFARVLGLLRHVQPTPRVLYKLDVEGLEYAVLPHALRHGALCAHVDALTVEFHARYAPLRVSDVSLPSVASAERREAALRAQLDAAARHPNCRLKRVLYVDDESHKMDGVPLP